MQVLVASAQEALAKKQEEAANARMTTEILKGKIQEAEKKLAEKNTLVDQL